MGLPRDVATHIDRDCRLHHILGMCSTFTPYSDHTPTIHRGVNATFAQGDGEPGCHPLARGMFLHLHYLAPGLTGDTWECS